MTKFFGESVMHKKDVTDSEIEIAMQPVYKEIEKFLVKRAFPINSDHKPLKSNTRKKKKKTQQNLTGQEKEYLLTVYEKPELHTNARAEFLCLSTYINNKIKSSIIKKGLAKQFIVNKGKESGGNITLLELTESGYKAIKKVQKDQRPKNVSAEHWWWQKSICNHFRKKGIKAELEKSINNNPKRADISIVWKGKYIAIEVELSPRNALNNIKKNMEAGFDKTITYCRNTLVLKKVNRQLESCIDYEQIKDRVEVRLLSDFEFVKGMK